MAAALFQIEGQGLPGADLEVQAVRTRVNVVRDRAEHGCAVEEIDGFGNVGDHGKDAVALFDAHAGQNPCCLFHFLEKLVIGDGVSIVGNGLSSFGHFRMRLQIVHNGHFREFRVHNFRRVKLVPGFVHTGVPRVDFAGKQFRQILIRMLQFQPAVFFGQLIGCFLDGFAHSSSFPNPIRVIRDFSSLILTIIYTELLHYITKIIEISFVKKKK